MTRKGEYAILHEHFHGVGFTERHIWTIILAATCFRDGRVKGYYEAPARYAIRAGNCPEQEFLPIPAYAQPAAKRIFEAQRRFETVDELKAALEAQD